MNPRMILLLSVAGALLAGCSQSGADRAKAELIAADKAFSAQSAKEGTQAAFIEVAASDVKVLDQKSLTGIAAIEAEYKDPEPGATLTWEPAYADVSSSGDLGYTWGRYTYLVPRKPKVLGMRVKQGTYVTVWRRESGAWKVVLDGGTPDDWRP
jgi:hypothetical protein